MTTEPTLFIFYFHPYPYIDIKKHSSYIYHCCDLDLIIKPPNKNLDIKTWSI